MEPKIEEVYNGFHIKIYDEEFDSEPSTRGISSGTREVLFIDSQRINNPGGALGLPLIECAKQYIDRQLRRQSRF